MNERIKELATEAGYTPLPGFDFANDLQEVFLKKFAELIVKECADFVDSEIEKQDEMPCVYGDQIKQHFGVE